MSTFDLDRIKQIDQKTMDMVFGYIKQLQNKYKSSSLLINDNIPQLVLYIALAFYHNPVCRLCLFYALI